MKKFFLWILLVLATLALILGGTFGFLYITTDENKIPNEKPALGGTELDANGYWWEVPVLGGIINKTFESPETLTVQKLGDFGNESPILELPAWATEADVVLRDPDGKTVIQGDETAFNSYCYTQNGQYELVLTLTGSDTQKPAKPQGYSTYHVRYSVNLQPTVTMSTSRAAQGSIVAVEITGLLEQAEPELETDLGSVWFRRTVSGWMGYIPVTHNAEGGTHTMTLTCGSLRQELTLSVIKKETSRVPYPEEEEETGTKEFQDAIWPLYTAGSEEKLWSGCFVAPTTAAVLAPYGAALTTDEVKTGVATGIIYDAAEGSSVTAPMTGTVVYAGNLQLTGGTVVIDHGCGVKSFLYGLENVTVQLGQTVEKGENLGSTGSAHSLIWEIRIGSKSVDPSLTVSGQSGLQYHENS